MVCTSPSTVSPARKNTQEYPDVEELVKFITGEEINAPDTPKTDKKQKKKQKKVLILSLYNKRTCLLVD